MTESDAKPTDFIREIVAADLQAGLNGGRVHTRFPPEPNGYLHIGHAKSICLNFGVAADFGGKCNLRFDDTNPTKEEQEYVDSIVRDVRWLGFDWEDRLFYASDYYEACYRCAEELILKGLAFVCDLTADQVREHRGTLTEPGRESPWRNRAPAESLDLFRRMRAGEFPDGSRTLRARIDMASGNINLRDPVLYRIMRADHHRTGDAWCIYPMYDYAHPVSDALEGITHSICTLEFEDHRPLYDWVLDNLSLPYRPRQYEFARLNLTHTVMSKRKLLQLVEGGRVRGWDDPRLPTIAGLRRRGFPPEAIRDFCGRIGVAKRDSTVDSQLLEFCVREHLNRAAPRVMGVLDPLRLVIENWPEGAVEEVEAVNNPEDPAAGTRKLPFSGELYIDREDFRETPPPKYYRLFPGNEVRLRYGYYVTCREVVRDGAGNVTEVRCTYDPASRGGETPDRRRVQGTIHWLSAAHAVPAEVRLYRPLFRTPSPGEGGGDFLDDLDPESLQVIPGALVEPGLAGVEPGYRCQFERLGYFAADPDSTPGRPVFNRIVTLRDSWAKIERKAGR
jgi:glutaminyl-tRNA synthetase